MEEKSSPYARIMGLLWCLKQLGFVADLRYYILSRDESIIEDMFLAMLPRIKKGIARNCLVPYMKSTPVFLRPVVILRIYVPMIEGMKELMKTIKLDASSSELISLLNPDTLERSFGDLIREHIRFRLGF